MTLQEQIDQLRAELALVHAQVAAGEWKHMHERFHAFDSIKNDACPACGGRVRVVETHNAVRLEAVA